MRPSPGDIPTEAIHRDARAGAWTFVFPSLIILAGLAAYSNCYSGAFVFDDDKHVINNPRIREVFPLSDTMSSRRPVVDLSLAINYAIGGLNTKGYHRFNVFVHILAALTLFGIVRRTPSLHSFSQSESTVKSATSSGEGPRGLKPAARRVGAAPWFAAVVALIWVVHPLLTQGVTYIIQRGESLMGLFYLLTLYCVIRGAASAPALAWYGLAVAACALGMGTKGVMVTAPVVVLIYDRTFLAGSLATALRRRWGLHLLLAATWVVLAVCGVAQGVLDTSRTGATVGFSYAGVTPLAYAQTQLGVIAHYLRLSLWPDPLCLDYAWPVARGWVAVGGPAVVIVPLVAATLWGLIRRSWWGFVGVWFFVILAPTSSFVPIKDLCFEHRMYLPIAAVVITVVAVGYAGLFRLFPGASSQWMRRMVATILVATVVALGIFGTLRRNRDYASEATMWRDVAAKRPASGRAHLGVGTTLYKEGRWAEAEQSFRLAILYRPGYPEAHYNLGNALNKTGKPEEAVTAFREALRRLPDHAKAHYNLANTFKELGRPDEAIESYKSAVRCNPRYNAAYINLGNTLKRQWRLTEAIEQYNKALAIKPDYANTHFHLGDAYQRQGRLAEALAEYNEALRIDPEHKPATNARNVLMAELDRSE